MRNNLPVMGDRRSTNGRGKMALNEDVADEDETRLIIDESRLPPKDNRRKLRGKRVSRLLRLKSRKDVHESANTYPCPECGKMFKRKVKLQSHLVTHKTKEKLECENCGKKFRKVDTLFDHVCRGFGNYNCPDCDECFKLKKDLVIHQQSHKNTSDELADEKDPSEALDFSSFVASFVKWPVPCSKCGAELADLEGYNVHMATHKEGEPCVCLVCKMKFSCRDDFLLHKDLCDIEGIFECMCCKKRFHTEKNLSEHLESHYEDISSCDNGGLGFASKDKLPSHMTIHKTSIYPCRKCKKIFKCNSVLKNHTCISENHEKKSPKLTDPSEKSMSEQCPDSTSGNEESESEDVDVGDVRECYFCKVCDCTFENKEGLLLHLTNHSQCSQCKKYFKSQMDLNMHSFFLGDEKLYSCYMCEIIVHGKKELERHLNQHFGSDDVPSEDLEWDDNCDGVQNSISGLDGAEPLLSTSLDRPTANVKVKVNKVVRVGNNTLRCSSCGKLVYLRHNLSDHLKSNAQATDVNEEYVYISRFGNPQDLRNQTEDTYCTCHNSSDILSRLMERSPSKSLSDYECQDVQKMIKPFPIPRHSLSPKPAPEPPSNLKAKPVINEAAKDTSVMQSDVNVNNDPSNDPADRDCDRPNDSVILKSKTETSVAPLNSSSVLNKDTTKSPATNVSDVPTSNDCKNKSGSSKAVVQNTKLDGKKEVVSPQKPGVNIIRLDNRNLSLPIRLVNSIPGNGSAPVKLLVSTGLFSGPITLESVSELLNRSDIKKSVSTMIDSAAKKSNSNMNVINHEDLRSPSLAEKSNDNSSEQNVGSTPKEIKKEKFINKVSVSDLVGNKIGTNTTSPPVNTLKASNSKKVTTGSNSRRVKGEKRKNAKQQELNSSPSSCPKIPKSVNSANKTDPVMLRVDGDDDEDKSPKVQPQYAKKEEGEGKTRPDGSTPNVDGSETCYIPDNNMVFKVEQLDDESEDEDEEEASLDFNGIKKEFLASDVFIKEEEWDIVDF